MNLRRGLFVVVFLALTVSAVNAYTVVMRDGRRVEIPNEFTVTNSTLTYAVSNGFQVTIQLNAVDIAATERANNEGHGSLLRKANAPKVPVERASQNVAQRSITNADLEKYRRARVEGEKEYESRRVEMGLPTPEERRREVEAIQDRTLEQVRNMRAQEEALWRSRAEALRAEMAVKQAQFESMRQRSDDTPWAYSFGGFPGFFPFDNVGFGIAGPFNRFNRFNRFHTSPFDGFLATPITPFPTFPVTGFRGRGVFRSPVRINPRPVHGGHGRRR